MILKENHYLKENLEFQNLKDHNSNILVKARVENKLNPNQKHFYLEKTIPLLDPIHYLLNNYNVSKQLFFLPSNYNFNTFSKINDYENNMAI